MELGGITNERTHDRKSKRTNQLQNGLSNKTRREKGLRQSSILQKGQDAENSQSQNGSVSLVKDVGSLVDSILEIMEGKGLSLDEMQEVSCLLKDRLELMEKEAKS